MKMTPPNILLLGISAFAFLVECGAQQQFQFSSFDEIPQSLLDQLGSEQIKELKKELADGRGGGGSPGQSGGGSSGQSPKIGGGGSPTQQQFQFSNFDEIPQSLLVKLGSEKVKELKRELGGGGSPGKSPNGGGGGSPRQQQFQFSNFDEIPQSILNELSSQQIRELKRRNGGGGGSPGQGPNGGGGGSPRQQQFQFSNFDEIPQSLLNELSSQQIRELKLELRQNGGGGGSPGQSGAKQNKVKTMKLELQDNGGGGGGQQQTTQPGRQTFQFSTYSEIPQSFLDELTSSQLENIRRELMPQPVQQPQQQQQLPQNQQQTLQFSTFSQIPQNVLDQFTSEQILQIKMMLDQKENTIRLPAEETSYTYTLPGGNNKRVNNVMNTLFNYVAAGGYLTGVPPIDLMLLRFYINMGPEKFC